MYLKQYSKHRLWPTVLWDLTGRKYTTLRPDQCKDKWIHCTRFNIMELVCVCDLSFLRSSHTVQDFSLILLNTEWRGTHTSCISAPRLLHYPSSWSRQSFYCTQAPATEPRTAKASFHFFYFQKKDIIKTVCVLVLLCQKGIHIHWIHNRYPSVTRQSCSGAIMPDSFWKLCINLVMGSSYFNVLFQVSHFICLLQKQFILLFHPW